jgi:hypothetical protein
MLSGREPSVICYKPEMTSKAFRTWLFPILSLAVGLVGLVSMLLIGERAVPFGSCCSAPHTPIPIPFRCMESPHCLRAFLDSCGPNRKKYGAMGVSCGCLKPLLGRLGRLAEVGLQGLAS